MKPGETHHPPPRGNGFASCEALSDSATSAGSDIVPWTATSDGSPRPGGLARKKNGGSLPQTVNMVCIYTYMIN